MPASRLTLGCGITDGLVSGSTGSGLQARIRRVGCQANAEAVGEGVTAVDEDRAIGPTGRPVSAGNHVSVGPEGVVTPQ